MLVKHEWGFNSFYKKEGGNTYKFYSNIEQKNLKEEHDKYFVLSPIPYKGFNGSVDEQCEKRVVGLYYLAEEVKELSFFGIAYIGLSTGDTYAIFRVTDEEYCFTKTKKNIEELIISGNI
jgi:hypothetical protein